jgi:hypothetical protein
MGTRPRSVDAPARHYHMSMRSRAPTVTLYVLENRERRIESCAPCAKNSSVHRSLSSKTRRKILSTHWVANRQSQRSNYLSAPSPCPFLLQSPVVVRREQGLCRPKMPHLRLTPFSLLNESPIRVTQNCFLFLD